MAIYMGQFTYTTEAIQTLTKNPQDRRGVFAELLQKLDARLISLYYCFGECDGVALFEAPDDGTASAAILAAVSARHVKTVRTSRLFTPEEMVEVMRKAGGMTYQAPFKE